MFIRRTCEIVSFTSLQSLRFWNARPRLDRRNSIILCHMYRAVPKVKQLLTQHKVYINAKYQFAKKVLVLNKM